MRRQQPLYDAPPRAALVHRDRRRLLSAWIPPSPLSLLGHSVVREGVAGYFPMREGEAGWQGSRFVAYKQQPSFVAGDPLVRYLDLDGDGIVDALRTGERFECFFQRNAPPALSGQARPEGWSQSYTLPRTRDLKSFPDVRFDDPRVRLADMNGDGLQDIVLIQDRRIDYWPNRGWGRFGGRVTLMSSPDLPANYNPAHLLLADVDGDGCADLVYVESGRVTIWLNQGGNSLTAGRVIRGTPPVSDMAQVQLVDLLGQGTAGLLFDVPTSASAVPRRFFLDLLCGKKPYMLHTTENQMGARTTVHYRSSVVDLLRDARAGKPWKTPLPFPTLVVGSTTSEDLISHVKVTTEYSYHHGYWDPREREFRGFARVETRDTPEDTAQSNHPISVPLLSKSWFHVGPVGDAYGGWHALDVSEEYWSEDPQRLTSLSAAVDPSWSATERRDALRTLRGSVLRTELYALDESAREARPYTVSETVTGVRRDRAARTDAAGRYHPAVHFPYARAVRTSEWDRGSEPMTSVQLMGAYDAQGHLLSQTAIAVPRGRNGWEAAVFSTPSPGPEPYLATHTRTVYAETVEDATTYLSGRVALVTSWEVVAGEQESIPSVGDAPSVLEVHAGVEAAFVDGEPLPAYVACIGQAATYYDGAAFEGLALGELGAHGMPVRSEALVMTQADVEAAYPDGVPAALTESAPTWGAGYPAEFTAGQAAYLGYTRRASAEGALRAGWWVQSSRVKYDYQQVGEASHGRMLVSKDVLGASSSVGYDAQAYLPVQVTDALGLVTQAVYDTRLLVPRRMRDPNENWVQVQYSPLGLVRAQAVLGKISIEESVEVYEGDTPETPRQRFEYDLMAWADEGEPLWVRTRTRKHHTHETDVALPARDEELVSVEYSDGFGRVIQARAQAEELRFGEARFGDAGLSPDMMQTLTPALGVPRGETAPERVVVSGYKRYDNKGRVIEQWEPFYDEGWDWRPEYEGNDPSAPRDSVAQESLEGVRSRVFYDARGRVYRTQHADGSEERVVFGVPGSIASPDLSKVGLDEYEPTPWELYAYDRNDLAEYAQDGSSATPEAAAVPVGHYYTPSSTRVDAMGRAVEVVERNGADPEDWYVTRTSYDIRGNALTIRDALERVAATQVYDLANRSLRSVSIDAGTSWSVLDARSQPIEAQDMRGARTLTLFDVAGRPTRLWCQDRTGAPVRLAQVLMYGDEVGVVSTPEASNHKGKLHTHLDEVGRQVLEAYDFQGNVLEKVRHVLDAQLLIDAVESTNTAGNDYEIAPYAIDWTPGAGESLVDKQEAVLGSWEYRVSSTFDALGRPKQVTYPLDVDSERKVLVPTYNRAGALSRLVFDGTVYVEHIAYNARGQKVLYARGNGVMTRYAYDPKTLRLRRLRSEVYTKSTVTGGIVQYAGTGTKHQDYGYAYDLNGNITAILDHTTLGAAVASTVVVTPDVPGYPYGIPNNVYRRVFGYDAINRLVSATGMEHVSTNLTDPWTAAVTPQTSDPNDLRQYLESYTYDPMGNLELMQHTASGHSFSRSISTVGTSNRLAELSSGALEVEYAYDAAGNMTQEHTARHFEWNAAGRLVCFRTQVTGQQASLVSQYGYDAAMWRTLKVVSTGSTHLVTVNIDGFFEHMINVMASTTEQNNQLSVMLGDSRAALINLGHFFTGEEASPLEQYILEDHLGSSKVVVDGANSFVNRQEFTPYGESSYGSFGAKRYQFIGCENDKNGLTYCHNRYLFSYLGRFSSCDPLGFVDGLNVFKYSKNNPISFNDKEGKSKNYFSKKQNEEGGYDYEISIDAVIVDDTDKSYYRTGDFEEGAFLAPISHYEKLIQEGVEDKFKKTQGLNKEDKIKIKVNIKIINSFEELGDEKIDGRVIFVLRDQIDFLNSEKDSAAHKLGTSHGMSTQRVKSADIRGNSVNYLTTSKINRTIQYFVSSLAHEIGHTLGITHRDEHKDPTKIRPGISLMSAGELGFNFSFDKLDLDEGYENLEKTDDSEKKQTNAAAKDLTIRQAIINQDSLIGFDRIKMYERKSNLILKTVSDFFKEKVKK